MMTVWLSSLIALLCVKQDYADLGKITLCDWDKKSNRKCEEVAVGLDSLDYSKEECQQSFYSKNDGRGRSVAYKASGNKCDICIDAGREGNSNWNHWACIVLECAEGWDPATDGTDCVASPTLVPTTSLPTGAPSFEPSAAPSASPTHLPSSTSPTSTRPSSIPSANPTTDPSSRPSLEPSVAPSASPTHLPSSTSPTSTRPSSIPSANPTTDPSSRPSLEPSAGPSFAPSLSPNALPTPLPTPHPSPGCASNESVYHVHLQGTDGWDGATFLVTQLDDGEWSVTGTLESGEFTEDFICMSDGCYEMTIEARDEGSAETNASVFFAIEDGRRVECWHTGCECVFCVQGGSVFNRSTSSSYIQTSLPGGALGLGPDTFSSTTPSPPPSSKPSELPSPEPSSRQSQIPTPFSPWSSAPSERPTTLPMGLPNGAPTPGPTTLLTAAPTLTAPSTLTVAPTHVPLDTGHDKKSRSRFPVGATILLLLAIIVIACFASFVIVTFSVSDEDGPDLNNTGVNYGHPQSQIELAPQGEPHPAIV